MSFVRDDHFLGAPDSRATARCDAGEHGRRDAGLGCHARGTVADRLGDDWAMVVGKTGGVGRCGDCGNDRRHHARSMDMETGG